MAESITARELQAMLATATPPHLLDVRQPEEAEMASLPGSTLIPLGYLPFRAEELRSWLNDPIVVYCHHGIRSQTAIWQLERMGFTQLLNLTGGIDAWSVEVDPKTPRY